MTETPDITPIPVGEVTARSARVTIAIPDNQITMPNSPWNAKPFDVRLTAVTCAWNWHETYGSKQTFSANGHRTLKDGSDGQLGSVEFHRSAEPPTWMSDLVAPYVPAWWPDGAQS